MSREHDEEEYQPSGPKLLSAAQAEVRANKMVAEGRMPSLEKFLEAIAAGREEYLRSLNENGAVSPDSEPHGLIDVLSECLGAPATTKQSPLSIGDYEQVRDELRDIIGPGSWRAGIRIALKRDAVVPIRSVEPNSPRSEVGQGDCDLTVGRDGNIMTFAAHTEAGTRFLRECLHTEPWQWIGQILCLDHRLARRVLDGAENEGLRIGFCEVDRAIQP